MTIIQRIEQNPTLKFIFLGVCLLFPAALFIYFFSQIDREGNTLGIDTMWQFFRDWDIHYIREHGMRHPPWSVLIFLPISNLLSDGAAWGLLVYMMMITLILSVPTTSPRKWQHLLAVFLLVTSFPALRTAADANFEIIVTLGAVLTVYGFNQRNLYILALGLLHLTAKPQSAILAILVIGISILIVWSPREWLMLGGLLLVAIIPSMLLWGDGWLMTLRVTAENCENAVPCGSIMDISLQAATKRTEVIPRQWNLIFYLALLIPLAWVIWKSGFQTFSREKCALLIATSMLISPYAAGNSILTVLAVGVIPLFMRRFWLGLFLILAVNALYFWSPDWQYNYQAYYWTAYLLVCYLIFSWEVYHESPSNWSQASKPEEHVPAH